MDTLPENIWSITVDLDYREFCKFDQMGTIFNFGGMIHQNQN